MKIVLTGATGFIGSNLLRALAEKGHDVVSLVRSTSDVSLLEKMKVPYEVTDILNADLLEELLKKISPQAVYHCAAAVMDRDEDSLHRVNIESTRNICRACYANHIGKLIYLSSVAVISGNEQVPLRDEMPYKASNPYGRSKIEAERTVMQFREKGLSVCVVRPCMVYGHGEPHALDRILAGVRKRQIPLVDVKGMDSKLHLVHVGNLVQLLLLTLEKEEALEGSFIVADKQVITLRKFLEICYREMGMEPPVVPAWLFRLLSVFPPVKRRAERIFKDRVYDISRAREILGYEPEISTKEGLREVVSQWRKEQEASENV
ncbi:MAG: NAD-dependent epimerase/dehydratase family protein [Candidatus Omnitrophica bacterium]|nr:NAD-dependent epimerase/dehydratase family protein [Candidatus Omnitrophota bacterium]